jgi:hypothetical protein
MAKNQTTTNSDKLVKIKITDHTGDTRLEQKIDEAIATIVKEHFAQARQPYVGVIPFQFDATSLDDAPGLLGDTIRLRELLDEHDEPVVKLLPPLQGGC